MKIDTLFYLVGVFFILYEFSVMFNSKFFCLLHRYMNAMKRMDTKEREKVKLPPGGMTFVLFDLWYFWWTIVGLLTSQWVLFLLLRGLSICFHGEREKSSKILLLDSVVSLIVLLLIYVNKFIWLWRLDISVRLYQTGL